MFNAAELRRECEVFKHLAGGLISPQTRYVLDEFETSLSQILRSPDAQQRWEVREDRPLRTLPSGGDHEPDSERKAGPFRTTELRVGGHPAALAAGQTRGRGSVGGDRSRFAVLSLWVAASRPPAGPSKSPPTARPESIFIASCRGPGSRSRVFRHMRSLRWGALEFLLTEVFRSKWREALGQDSPRAQMWSGIQRKRFETVLKWATSVVSGGGSPVVVLQQSVPSSEIFL